MKYISAFILLLSLVSKLAFSSQFDNAKTHWNNHEYKEVIELLSPLREDFFGKRVDIDYMLATSLCRYENFYVTGKKYFKHILRVYNLSKSNIDIIHSEANKCPVPDKPILISFTLGRGMGGVSGKSFYFLGRDNESISGNPLQAIRPIEKGELEKRLVDVAEKDLAKKKVNERLKSMGYQPKVFVNGKFVISSISNHTQFELSRITSVLNNALEFYQTNYQFKIPNKLFTIYLVPDGLKLKEFGDKLHGLNVNTSTIGYSFRDDLSLAAIVNGPNVGTLKHELTHLLVRTNFGDIPPWLDEGLAALYEVSRQEGKYLRGLPNWRGQILEHYFDRYPVDIINLMAMNWDEFDATREAKEKQAVHHALARYWMLYLQDLNHLTQVYTTFRDVKVESITDDYKADINKAIYAATGETLELLQEKFFDWLQHAKLPITREQVMDIQKRLISLGYSPGSIDGFSGPNTNKAIRQFQQDNDIEPDGRIDMSLISLLMALTGK